MPADPRIASERARLGVGRRGAALLLALAVEALVVLLLLFLAPSFTRRERPKPTVFGIDLSGAEDAAPDRAKAAEKKADARRPAPQRPRAAAPEVPRPRRPFRCRRATPPACRPISCG